MSLRMLLDGPDLRGILNEVEATYGRNFRVVQAEQVRTGGVAGFFAKQHYEVTVEISDPDIVADITSNPIPSGKPLAELATRSQNDQAAASAEAWARDLLQKARELNEPGAAPQPEPEPVAPRGVPLLDADAAVDDEGRKSRRWRRKKTAERAPSDRMLPATPEQQTRLKDLLAQGALVEDAADDLSPADRIIAMMDAEHAEHVEHVQHVEHVESERLTQHVQTSDPAHEIAPVASRIPGIWLLAMDRAARRRDEREVAEEHDAQVRALFQLVAVSSQDAADADLDHETEAAWIEESASGEHAREEYPREESWRARMTEEINELREELQMLAALREAVEQARPPVEVDRPQQPLPRPVTLAPRGRDEGLGRSLSAVQAGGILAIVGDARDAHRQALAIIDACARPETRIFAIVPVGMSLPSLSADAYFRPSEARRVVALVRELAVPAIVVVHVTRNIMLNETTKARVMQTIDELQPSAMLSVVDPAWRLDAVDRLARSSTRVLGAVARIGQGRAAVSDQTSTPSMSHGTQPGSRAG